MNQLLEKSKSALYQDKHSIALQNLNALTRLIKDNQTAIVASFLPDFYESFKTQKQQIEDDLYDNGNTYGVIFSRTYINNQHHSLYLNIIHFDPSIEEYWSLVNSPKLVKNLENTRIIKLDNNIKALKKLNPDRQYYEYNILPSNQLLISIVGNGLEQSEAIDSLIQEIDFKGLLQYLSN